MHKIHGLVLRARMILIMGFWLFGVLGWSVSLTLEVSGQESLLSASAQSSATTAPLVEWNQTYNRAYNDEMWCVVETTDGGYALAGWTGPLGGPTDFWLIRTNSTGHVEWNKTYGGIRNDHAYSVVQTVDGYALAGSRVDASFYRDFYLVKTYSDGTMDWNKTYGGIHHERAYSLVLTREGGYALAGETWNYVSGTDYDVYLVKTYSDGTMDWNKTYGGTEDDSAWSVQQTSDDGYIMAGYTDSFGAGNDDFYLVKTYSDGTMDWNKTYGGTEDDRAFSVVQASDGGYALAGWTDSFGVSGRDFWLVKVDSSGNHEWNKTYGGGIARSVVETADRGYALAGSAGLGGLDDILLVKVDSSGNMQWNITCGGPSDDNAYYLIQTSDGGYAIAGETGYDGWLVKIAGDVTPPITTDNYDGLWHTEDILINLTASDEHSDVFETYYRINDGENKTVSVDGDPVITTEGPNNNLTYWSVDVIGNKEDPETLHNIKLDKTLPITTDDYDFLWHTEDITLTLTASDEHSDVFETYYRINDGENKTVSADGDPVITTEGPNNNLTYWSVDNAGNEEPANTLPNIKLDKNPPLVIITVSLNDTEIRSSTYEVRWDTEDEGSSLDYCRVRVDGGGWTNMGRTKTYTLDGLGDGSHTFDIEAVDNIGQSKIYSVNFAVNTSPIGGPGYLEEALLGFAVTAAAVGLVVYKIVLPRWRKPRLRIQAEPKQIVADGKSKSTIRVQLQDRKGKLTEASEDIGTTLTIKPPLGKIENPKLSISKGKDSAQTSLVSPKEIDEEKKVIELSAVAEGLKGHRTKITFLRSARYCMGCGTKMSAEAQRVGECENCHAKVTEFRGTPLWTCKECKRKGRETHNPLNAKFCPECGASKPE